VGGQEGQGADAGRRVLKGDGTLTSCVSARFGGWVGVQPGPGDLDLGAGRVENLEVSVGPGLRPTIGRDPPAARLPHPRRSLGPSVLRVVVVPRMAARSSAR
jgi:hypothetical protein